MTLRYSRRSFRRVVWKSSSETWARLHEEAFRYFGGCPQYVVLDNLKEGVIKPDIYEPELNRVYAAMLAHYGVPDSTDISHRRYGLQAFRDFAWRLSGNPFWRDSSDLLWINDSFRHLGVRFYILNSAVVIDFRSPKNYQVPIPALQNLVGNHSSDERLFGVVLAHHGPIAGDILASEAIENWAQVSKSIQNTPVRMFIHGHGHARLADVVPLSGEAKQRKAEGKLDRGEMLRIMAPTTHLNSTKRPLVERRGFNLVTLKRNYGKVEEVEIESYELSDTRPHLARDGPWSVRV